MKTTTKATLAAVAMAMAATGANAAQLLTNGNFETGDLSGWTVTDQAGGSGSWFAQGNGAGTALNTFPTPTLAGGGSFNAGTDQGGPGSHTLSQTFNGTLGGQYNLAFDAYAIDQSGAGPVGTGTDFTNVPNQHVEISVNGNVIYSGILTSDWASYAYNISSFVVTGVNTVSFTEVDNQLFLNEGLDNISLTTGVPEPATWAMMLLGFGGLGFVMRRRRNLISVA